MIKNLWIVFVCGIIAFMLFILAVGYNLFGLFGELPSFEVLSNPQSAVASEVYSSDGKLLGKYFYNFNRSPVEYNEIPKTVTDALIATEDSRFYDHSGIDGKGIVAIMPSLLMGKRRGSSTLTQQLAKNLFELREADDYKGVFHGVVIDKIKEWFVAVQLERAYTKKEILVMYLNTVDFGNNSHGIKNAARRYFDRNLKDLKTEEIALLIGLLKGPSYYNPRREPERALNRRNTVLAQMVKYDYLTEVEYDALSEKPMKLNFSADGDNSGLAPYLRAYLKPYLKEWCKQHGKKLYEDGLKIYTTIDSHMQLYAEQAVTKHMSALQKEFFLHWKGRAPWTDEEHHEIKGFIEKMAKRSARYRELKEELGDNDKEIFAAMKKPVKMRVFSWRGDRDTMMSPWDSIKYTLHYLHTGFISIEPKTGFVRAWVGDINYKYFKYDHVKQGLRQPGSTFKPLLYATAIELNGLNPDSKVMDAPQTYTLPDGKTWTPKNSDGKYSNDYLTLRQALGKSVNTVSAYLISNLTPKESEGPATFISYAKRMGITSPLDPSPTICLGTSDVSVFELVNAYTVFVNEGRWTKPRVVLRIEDKYGNTLEEFNPESSIEEFRTASQVVLEEETAAKMIELLKGSVEDEGGTSVSLKSLYKIPGEVGGKTGTTQGSSDGWFIGITPELVSGAWVGGEERSIRFRTMQYGQGAKMALPIFGYYMQKVYGDHSLDYKYTFKGVEIPQDSINTDTEEPLPSQSTDVKPETGIDF
ncbi:MAG TPA: transglycosylase domain-containing protein [Cytophagaceae bacterium]|nr:transglycosylase domain-containing protein [Cytophagaceae bacterium]